MHRPPKTRKCAVPGLFALVALLSLSTGCDAPGGSGGGAESDDGPGAGTDDDELPPEGFSLFEPTASAATTEADCDDVMEYMLELTLRWNLVVEDLLLPGEMGPIVLGGRPASRAPLSFSPIETVGATSWWGIVELPCYRCGSTADLSAQLEFPGRDPQELVAEVELNCPR